MTSGTFIDNFRKGWLSQFQLGQGFNPDSAFGANMVSRSNLQNPNPIRDTQNAAVGAQSSGGTPSAFDSLFDPEKIKSALANTGINMGIGIGGNVLGRLIGGNVGAAAGDAAASVGSAAAQGFTNPLSDFNAGMSLVKLFRRLF